ncbi:DUF3106 domain-containing protein [Burkholderiaceae bacterium UC74_6]
MTRINKQNPLSALHQAAGLLAACAFLVPTGSWAQDAAASAPAPTASFAVPEPARLKPPSSLETVPEWPGLTAAQRQALAPLERDWAGMDATQRSKWLEIAPRFAALPEAKRERLHERMRDWVNLSPLERQQARVGYRWAQQVNNADDRAAKWEAYQALPAEKRRELAEKAAHKQAAKPCAQGAKCPTATADLDAKPKSNLVPPLPKPAPAKAVAPSVVQAKPGATTVLITQATIPPAHQQAGQTKVWADPELVDSKTLLPKKPTRETSR